MKTFGVCAVGGAVAFLVMSMQMGLLGPSRPEAAEPEDGERTEDRQSREPLPFPEGLHPACRGNPVPAAAAFKRGSGFHPLVLLRTDGNIHSWQECLDSEWSAETVERTQLVVVLSPQRRIKIGTQTYPNAPAVDRFKYELDAHLIVARTGKVLSRKRFYTMPRQVREVESYELTALGEPVSFREVFSWLASESRSEASTQTASGPEN
jgi:hypothetical protein